MISGVIKFSASLPKKQYKVIDRLAKKDHGGCRSAAIRDIVNDYERRAKERERC